MRILPEMRAISIAQYIIETRATVRSAAKKFSVSKSTVHTAVAIPNGFGRRSRRFPNRGAFPAPSAPI